jgi:hypothetical protein
VHLTTIFVVGEEVERRRRIAAALVPSSDAKRQLRPDVTSQKPRSNYPICSHTPSLLLSSLSPSCVVFIMVNWKFSSLLLLSLRALGTYAEPAVSSKLSDAA